VFILIFLDLKPVSDPYATISDHSIAEEIFEASSFYLYSLPKVSPIYMEPRLRSKSILCLATSGAEFSLGSSIVNLVFDIRGLAGIDEALGTQASGPSHQGKLVQVFKHLLHTDVSDRTNSPLDGLSRAKSSKAAGLVLGIDFINQDILRLEHTEQLGPAVKLETYSIPPLSLQDVDTLTEDLIYSALHSAKAFLLTGHDTTSNKLTYIPAIMNQQGRLHQPAETARTTGAWKGLTVRTPAGDEYCLDNPSRYIHQGLIHRYGAVYRETARDSPPET
ncbi:unnamed protein product, partial [Clonostachys solani]